MKRFPNIPNIHPKVWGKTTWKFLHAVSLTYPDSPTDDQKDAMRALFNSLVHTLPCHNCRINLTKELAHMPIDVSSKQALNSWLLRLHNQVNQRLGQTQMSVDDVMQLVFKQEETKRAISCVTLVILIVVCIITVVVHWRLRKM